VDTFRASQQLYLWTFHAAHSDFYYPDRDWSVRLWLAGHDAGPVGAVGACWHDVVSSRHHGTGLGISVSGNADNGSGYLARVSRHSVGMKVWRHNSCRQALAQACAVCSPPRDFEGGILSEIARHFNTKTVHASRHILGDIVALAVDGEGHKSAALP